MPIARASFACQRTTFTSRESYAPASGTSSIPGSVVTATLRRPFARKHCALVAQSGLCTFARNDASHAGGVVHAHVPQIARGSVGVVVQPGQSGERNRPT